MTVNPKIKEILTEYGIDVQDGLAYLLSIYFDCRPSYTPPILVQKINITNILGIVDHKLHWNISLFSESTLEDTKWDWITLWMDKFSNKNSLRRGTKSSSITRMKTFFSENPSVRKEDVLAATDMYLYNTAANYVMKSHKFIHDGVGKMRNSTLEEWLDKYYESLKEVKNEPTNVDDITTQMQ